MSGILHPGYGNYSRRIGSTGLSAILEAAGNRVWGLEAGDASKQIEKGSLSRGLFRMDGKWFAHFLLVEDGASVVEYKYVIADGNRIAGLRRVLVKGPSSPFRSGHVVRYVDPVPAREKEYRMVITFLMSHSFQYHPTDCPPLADAVGAD
jgi:hypothetical protein